jgi:hypothetical protein
MATSRDILLNSTPTVAASSSAPPSTVTHALSESPSIVPSDAIKTEGIADLALEPELARVRFEAFREFATGRRRRELAAKASSGAQTGLNNNVQQLRTALNLVEKCLCAAGWCIQRAIELARETSTRPSELTRASKLLDEFDRAKPVMTPAKQFGVRVRETLAAADLKPSKASAVMHLALSTVYRWMSGKVLPLGNEANRTAAAALEGLVNKPGYLQSLFRLAWQTVDRPAHISEKQWRAVLASLRRGGHCHLEGAELSQKIEEFLTAPRKCQRAPYRLPRDLGRWPPVPRAEVEAYKRLAQLRSEPNWEEIR